MVLGAALRVHAAKSVDGARVDALAADAGLAILAFDVGLTGRLADSAVAEGVGRAVRLSSAAHRFASTSDGPIGWIAFVSLATDAGGLVIGRPAIGVRSAAVAAANVLTFRLASFAAADG